MGRRKTLFTKDEKDYEGMITKCLTSSKRSDWGCLSKSGQLFSIRTLRQIQIPLGIVKDMVRAGKIELNERGYYNWCEEHDL